jgi:tetratricopeptide (TPR) repeat protein
MLLTALVLTGCESTGRPDPTPSLAEARQAYEAGNYTTAYRRAARAAKQGERTGQAAYLAGLAARQQDRPRQAGVMLRRAIRRGQGPVVADARAELGLVLSHQGRHRQAASQLTRAARDMTGPNRARALFYAGLAQQKSNQWQAARRSLQQAADLSQDPELRRRAREHLRVTGFGIQVAAFREPDNARRAARQWRDRARRAGLDGPRLVRDEDGLIRVHLGEFSSHAAAEQARQRLGAEDAIIVPLSGSS